MMDLNTQRKQFINVMRRIAEMQQEIINDDESCAWNLVIDWRHIEEWADSLLSVREEGDEE